MPYPMMAMPQNNSSFSPDLENNPEPPKTITSGAKSDPSQYMTFASLPIISSPRCVCLLALLAGIPRSIYRKAKWPQRETIACRLHRANPTISFSISRMARCSTAVLILTQNRRKRKPRRDHPAGPIFGGLIVLVLGSFAIVRCPADRPDLSRPSQSR
jgi:hypothetical protein